MIGILLALWQLLASHPTSTLPSPTKVLTDSWELIADPFYDRGAWTRGFSGISSPVCGGWRSASASPRWWVSRSAC
jgi:hypothetical protein